MRFIKQSMSLFYIIRGRKYYYVLTDIVIVVASLILSYILRFYPDLLKYTEHFNPLYFSFIIPSYILSFYLFQVYRIMWGYSNINDVYRLILGNITGFLFFISSVFFFHLIYSRIMFALSFMIISILTIFYRIVIRDLYSRRKFNNSLFVDKVSKIAGSSSKRIIIVGAGEAGRTFLSEYKKNGLGKTVIGFIDDDKNKVGKILNGKPVFSTTAGIHDLIYKYDANEVLIAMPSAGADTINKIVSIIKRENKTISIKILPAVAELVTNQPLITTVRDISIEDLIGREEFRIDRDLIRERFEEKTVLITGAGGSIGSEICRQILKFNIKRLIAVGRGENSIYDLIKSLTEYVKYIENKPEITYRIVDVKDPVLLEQLFVDYSPDITIHAAAHKHVPLMEFNEIEALQNNISGTLNVLNLCLKYKSEEFVLVSTDKAVRPVSIMGATKRVAEIITEYYYKMYGLHTSVVRFGNVIGSRGSVIPLFREQIERRGPVTVTHPDICRYFMSIPEASLLVINAAAFSKGGECFVLDMGRQFKVIDIANRLIELYGFKPGVDIKIEFTGLRPGEKMHEELFYENEKLMNTANKKIFIVNNTVNIPDNKLIEDFLSIGFSSHLSSKPDEIRGIIKTLVPEFNYNTFDDYNEYSHRMVN